jgi:hypothetical protein
MSKASFTGASVATYDHALWTGSGRWRGVLAIVLLILSFLGLSTAILARLRPSQGGVEHHGEAER